LADLSKFEIFLQELSSVEVQASAQVELYDELLSRYKELEKRLSALQKENDYLKLQLENGEHEAVKVGEGKEDLFCTLSGKEREALKSKITEVIAKLNNQLSS